MDAYTFRSYYDQRNNITINSNSLSGSYTVTFSCDSLTEEQANYVFDYLLRPLVYDLKTCGLNVSKNNDSDI